MNELVEEFGAASQRGSGVLFVGAGLSQAAGLPGWLPLIDGPRREAGVPKNMTDAPLVAQYIEDSARVGRPKLINHVLREITRVDPKASLTEVHRHVARLRIREIWTTNYDELLESACDDAITVVGESNVHDAGSRPKTIVKMHGSSSFGPPAFWAEEPTLTRSDYERYEDNHRRMWTMLQAVYLSRTILFVGFSFSDPNVELLHKLARRHGMAAGNRHFAILRPPDAGSEKKRYELQRDDLERSGIRVAEIANHDDLETVFQDLVVRTREPKLFISGSSPGADISEWCLQMAARLASEPSWAVASLGGEAGWLTSKQLAITLRTLGEYDPARIEIHFRAKDEAPPSLDTRVGMAIYSGLEREALAKKVLEESRAMLVIGGGARTHEEIQWANERGVGVVPLAASGGAARDYYNSVAWDQLQLGAAPAPPEVWRNLGDPSPDIACSAAIMLVRQAMYQTTP